MADTLSGLNKIITRPEAGCTCVLKQGYNFQEDNGDIGISFLWSHLQ